jgi:signal transduction histidine kinase
MSPLATLILASCAIYGYVCIYYTLLATRRRREQEYLAFGLLSGGLGLYAFSELLYVGAETTAAAVRAHRIGSVALLIVAAFLVDFVAALLRRRNRARILVYLWALSGLVALGLGLLWEPGTPTHGPYLSLLPPIDAPAVRPTTAGLVYLATGALVPAMAGFALTRDWWPREEPEPIESEPAIGERYRRVIMITLGIALLCGIHDTAVWAGVLRSFRLLEHTTMLFIFGMSYMLLDRFVRASQTLSERTSELRVAYDDLRAKQHRLVRKQQLAAVGELSAVVAHEVRNPLAVIKNAVSGLRRATLRPADRDTLLSILDEETGRLNRLMHDLLAYARPVLPQGRELNAEELLRRAVERAMDATEEAEAIDLVWELEGPDHLYGDSELLRHALVNVLENAIQAMPDGGTLTVGTRAAILEEGEEGVSLFFRDTGEGMDTMVRDKARDPFFTTRPAGTGLGLAIVERVIRNHGGEVHIESAHGQGTEIQLILPTERLSRSPIPPPEGTSGPRLSGITEVPS